MNKPQHLTLKIQYFLLSSETIHLIHPSVLKSSFISHQCFLECIATWVMLSYAVHCCLCGFRGKNMQSHIPKATLSDTLLKICE